ncbi:MAG: hypothetical protein H0X47_13270 [Nitrospirales bacterium]|nr:hypothetical protein [Nitrospirales bacterium]
MRNPVPFNSGPLIFGQVKRKRATCDGVVSTRTRHTWTTPGDRDRKTSGVGLAQRVEVNMDFS